MVREKHSPAVLFPLSFRKSVFSGVQIGGVLQVKRKHKEIEQRHTIKVEENHNEF